MYFKNNYPNPILLQKISSILQDIQSPSCLCSPLLVSRFLTHLQSCAAEVARVFLRI